MKRLILLVMNISMFVIIFKLNPFLLLPVSYDKIFIFVALSSLLVFKKIKNVKIFTGPIIFLCFLLLYGVLISLNYNYQVNHQVYRFFLFVFESFTISMLIVIIYVKVLGKVLTDILKIVFYCILLQSIFIVFSFVSSTVFNIFDVIAPLEGTNFDEEISFRLYRGLSNTSGAAHSLMLSIGALLAFYFHLFYSKKFYLICIVPLFLASAINGRTGAMMIVLFALVYLIYAFKKGIVLTPIIITFFVILIGQSVVEYFFAFSTRNREISTWYQEAFSFLDEKGRNNSSFYSSFGDRNIFLPDKVVDIVFGAGYDPDQYNIGKGSDSGLIKNIFSFGIILTLLFYLMICYKIYKSSLSLGGQELYLSIGLILVLIISEYKEPFLVKTFLSRLIFIVILSRNLKLNGVLKF